MKSFQNRFDSILSINEGKISKINSFNIHSKMNLLDIYQIEIELLNNCNLKCPLCARANPEIKPYISKPIQLDLERLKKTLLLFPSLNKVHLVGGICEPTLYKNFIPLITWLKEQKFSIMISTNASTLNENKWAQIGNILNENDEIRFAIDGPTQETYSKYRIGGNLNKIINNFNAFSHSKAFKVLQMIKFKHNDNSYHDDINTIKTLCGDKFDHVYELPTGSESPELGLFYPQKTSSKMKFYQKVFNNLNNKKPLAKDIHCYSKAGFIYINHLGNFITCCDRYEDMLFDEGLYGAPFKPSIYNITDTNIDILLEYLNNIYLEIPNNKICIQYCHKFVQILQEPDDRIVHPIKKIKN